MQPPATSSHRSASIQETSPPTSLQRQTYVTQKRPKTYIRYSLCFIVVVINFVLLLISGSIMAISSVSLMKFYSLELITTEATHFKNMAVNLVWLFFFIGFTILLVSLLGIFGTVGHTFNSDSMCFKAALTFFIIIFAAGFILTILIAFGIIVMPQKISLKKFVASQLNSTMQKFKNSNSSDPYSVLWNYMQLRGQCCGIYTPDDWIYTDWANRYSTFSNQKWPSSCCQLINNQQTLTDLSNHGVMISDEEFKFCYTEDKFNFYQTGCLTTLEKLISNNSEIVIFTFLIIIILQSITVVISIYVLCSEDDDCYPHHTNITHANQNSPERSPYPSLQSNERRNVTERTNGKNSLQFSSRMSRV